MREFENIQLQINDLLQEWEPRLRGLSPAIVCDRNNVQKRNIKQILGHLIDSASNNQQRMVRLQYLEEDSLIFPDYYKDNDTWIRIQAYDAFDYNYLLDLFVSYNRLIGHIISHISPSMAENYWIDSDENKVSLRQMASGYLVHLKLHLGEIDELINQPD